MKQDNDILADPDELSKEDFDLTIKYNIFDILYLIEADTIKPIVITGYELNTSSVERCLEYLYHIYPISVYRGHNEKGKLRKYDTVYTSATDAYIALAKLQKEHLAMRLNAIAKKLKIKNEL